MPLIQRRDTAARSLTLRVALESGQYALFVADGGAQRKSETAAPVAGGFAIEHALRQRFGRGLLAMLRAMGAEAEGLSRGPVPVSTQEAARVWPFLTGSHIERLLWATHLVSVLGDSGEYLGRRLANAEVALISPIAHAVRVTTDKQDTLRDV